MGRYRTSETVMYYWDDWKYIITLEKVVNSFYETKHIPTHYGPAVPLLGIYRREMKKDVYKKNSM